MIRSLSAVFVLLLVAASTIPFGPCLAQPTPPDPTASPGSKLLWLSHNPLAQWSNFSEGDLRQTDDGGVIASWRSFDSSGMSVSFAQYVWPCGRNVFRWPIGNPHAVYSIDEIAAMTSADNNAVIFIANISSGETVRNISVGGNVLSIVLLRAAKGHGSGSGSSEATLIGSSSGGGSSRGASSSASRGSRSNPNSGSSSKGSGSTGADECNMVVNTDAFVTCFDWRTGAQLWTNTDYTSLLADGPIPCVQVRPPSYRVDDMVVCSSSYAQTYAITRRTGKTIWRAHGMLDWNSASNEYVVTRVANGFLLLDAGDGELLANFTSGSMWPVAAAVAPVSQRWILSFAVPFFHAKPEGASKATRQHNAKNHFHDSRATQRGQNNYPTMIGGLDLSVRGEISSLAWNVTTDGTMSRIGSLPFWGAKAVTGEVAAVVTATDFQAFDPTTGSVVSAYGTVQDYNVNAAPIASRWDHNVVYFLMSNFVPPDYVYVAAFKF